MKKVLSFLTALAAHNEKAWFDAHKDQYLEAKAHFDDFALRTLQGVAAFDPDTAAGLTLRDITYRIYRDIRFSPDKTPYKNHMGVYVCPGGKKSGRAGYYIHVEPATGTYFLCAGLYNPTPAVRQSIREEISLGAGDFDTALAACHGFQLPWDDALRRVPRGFNADDPHAELLRLRSYEIYQPQTKGDVLAPDFLAHALDMLAQCQPYNALLNKCVDYAEEQQ